MGDLLDKMLEVDVTKRLNTRGTLTHSWINNLAPDANGAVLLDRQLCHKLRVFLRQNRLKKVALQVIAHSMSEHQLGRLRRAFMGIDQDNSGSLQVDEIESVIANADMDPAVAIEMKQVLLAMAAENGNE